MKDNILTRIERIVNKTLTLGTSVRIMPRGTIHPIDQFATGTVRFAKKVGYIMPLIAPDNMYTLASDAVYGTNQIEVDRYSQWISSGGYIKVGNTELHKVTDVVDSTIIISDVLLADHPQGQLVYHYSSSIIVEGNYVSGKTIINVDTPYKMTVGDVIGISSSEDLDTFFVEYIVEEITQTGSSGNTIQYQITLNNPIHRDLEDEEEIQLIAYPAYFSNILHIPTVGSDFPLVGPFLVDWISGNLLAGLDITEVQTIQEYNSALLPVNTPITVNKNHQVLHVPIRADQLLFWDKVSGTINYDNSKKAAVAELDDDGNWWFKYTCIPKVEVPYTYAKGYIICIDPSLMVNNDYFKLSDAYDSIIFDYKVDASYTPIASAAATGEITVTGIPSDNDTFTLDDGFGSVVTFEFKRTGSFSPSDVSYKTVDITTSVLTTDVAIAMEQAINAVSTLQITANNVGPVLGLTNDNISQRGNTTIIVSSSALSITQQFIGGTEAVITVDISTSSSDLDVAKFTAAAINSSKLNISAEWPGIAPSVNLVSGDKGTLGNIPIVESVANSGFVVSGMSGGSGGAQWNFRVSPDQDITIRVRLFPNDFSDYTVSGGSTVSIPVILSPTDSNVERIDILINGTPNTKVYLYDWTINGDRVSAIQHSYVARVFGERNFASSTLILKPLFPSLDDLKTYLDKGIGMNTGHMRL